jgi:hypothetical protein
MVTAGGVFMAVTALEPSKTSPSVWANAWFDIGFGFVILGLLVAAAGFYFHFRRERLPLTAAGNGESQPTAAQERKQRPREREDGSSPGAPTVVAKTNHQRGSVVRTLRELLVEGRAMQARFGFSERPGPLAIVPSGLLESLAEWEAKVSAALDSWPGWLTQFQAAPTRRLQVFKPSVADVVYDKVEQRLRVLEEIVRGLEKGKMRP